MRTSVKIAFSLMLILSSTIAYAFSTNGEDSDGIYKTKHNLMRGIVLPKGQEPNEPCVWCHIPHDPFNEDTKPPKWMMPSDKEDTFDIYGTGAKPSSTSKGPKPDVMTRVCFTCHDGVNAPNISLYSEQASGRFNLNEASEITTKGSFVHSHPVGIDYLPSSKGGTKASLRPESHTLQGWSGAKTIRDLVSEGTIRCTSCHDPHTTNDLFLRTKNTGSTLCKGCHNK